MKWKENEGSNATYRKLLRVCCEAKVTSAADKICEVLNARAENCKIF